MGYVLNLQGRSGAAAAGEGPDSIISSASATVACAGSTLSYSICATLSTFSAAICM
ncbi:hypothetical protein ABZW11_11635 [Nonomuraea sp. NPDC004580]|uniref:hypothetical protein n=1 Tax=Nonomuraea sp. NPDC004580 TaxID=3154552 RepID=UPI0033B6FEFF